MWNNIQKKIKYPPAKIDSKSQGEGGWGGFAVLNHNEKIYTCLNLPLAVWFLEGLSNSPPPWQNKSQYQLANKIDTPTTFCMGLSIFSKNYPFPKK